jgi:uncharacterized protein YndB with AHSA1/START domain
MANHIHHDYFFPHPPEVVWEYLTTPELMSQWLMPNDFLPLIGHDFTFRTNPIPSLNFDGICYCKVLEINAPEKLSYSWKCGPGEGKITLDSVVVWTLRSKEDGTDLTLDHTGFKEIENFAIYTGMTDGWLKNLQKISVLINTKKDGAAGT